MTQRALPGLAYKQVRSWGVRLKFADYGVHTLIVCNGDDADYCDDQEGYSGEEEAAGKQPNQECDEYRRQYDDSSGHDENDDHNADNQENDAPK